jgi:hypothetical protein
MGKKRNATRRESTDPDDAPELSDAWFADLPLFLLLCRVLTCGNQNQSCKRLVDMRKLIAYIDMS